jgi:p-hydroxybenzoate 3-monooxygenase
MSDSSIENTVVHDKDFVPLRSVVHFPMQHGRLFLAGDAAHLVPPTGAKGMNLALFDTDILAHALVSAVRDGDPAALAAYSDTVLPRLWRDQEFSVWMTDTMHDAGDPTLNGPFRKMTARARLEELFGSSVAGRLHSDYQRGVA